MPSKFVALISILMYSRDMVLRFTGLSGLASLMTVTVSLDNTPTESRCGKQARQEVSGALS